MRDKAVDIEQNHKNTRTKCRTIVEINQSSAMLSQTFSGTQFRIMEAASEFCFS